MPRKNKVVSKGENNPPLKTKTKKKKKKKKNKNKNKSITAPKTRGKKGNSSNNNNKPQSVVVQGNYMVAPPIIVTGPPTQRSTQPLPLVQGETDEPVLYDYFSDSDNPLELTPRQPSTTTPLTNKLQSETQPTHLQSPPRSQDKKVSPSETLFSLLAQSKDKEALKQLMQETKTPNLDIHTPHAGEKRTLLEYAHEYKCNQTYQYLITRQQQKKLQEPTEKMFSLLAEKKDEDAYKLIKNQPTSVNPNGVHSGDKMTLLMYARKYDCKKTEEQLKNIDKKLLKF